MNGSKVKMQCKSSYFLFFFSFPSSMCWMSDAFSNGLLLFCFFIFLLPPSVCVWSVCTRLPVIFEPLDCGWSTFYLRWKLWFWTVETAAEQTRSARPIKCLLRSFLVSEVKEIWTSSSRSPGLRGQVACCCDSSPNSVALGGAWGYPL